MKKREDKFERWKEVDYDGFVGADGIAHEPKECVIRSDVPSGWEKMNKQGKINYIQQVYAFWIIRLWIKRVTEGADKLDKNREYMRNWNNFMDLKAEQMADVWDEIIEAFDAVVGIETKKEQTNG